jgi:PAS domain S-box-containing protein
VDATFLKKGLFTLLALFGLGLMLVALWLLSLTTQQATDFDRLHDWLLGLNIMGVALLLVVLGFNLAHLIVRYRRREPGTRLTARLVAVFSLLALVPVVLVFYFSMQFITRGIDSWFDVRIEQALEQSLELSRASLESRVREQGNRTQEAAIRLARAPQARLPLELEIIRRDLEASEVALFTGEGQIIATAGEFGHGFLPSQPDRELLLQVRRLGRYVGLDSPEIEGEVLHVRALVMVPETRMFGGQRILQARFPVPMRQSRLAENVQSSWQEYRELAFYRTPIRISFTLTLSLVMLLSLLLAITGAFHFARRLVAPVQDLVAGTRAVARGEFDTRLPLRAHDEVGYLAMSFNEMTRRLAEARELAAQSRRQVEEERAYLEAVLARLTSGVIALDSGLRVRASNEAASQILGLAMERHVGRPLSRAAADSPRLRVLSETVDDHVRQGDTEWLQELAVPARSGRRLLICRCTALPVPGELEPGYVVVFDDITTLVQAQRDAAWGEVARRLAHEIRNPLTPIQLAAERIRHKYLDRIEDGSALERATHTIIQQVEALKAMVNAFGEYARAPDIVLAALDLNHLVTEVADLYRGRPEGLRILLDLDDSVPPVEADAGRLRQILHNLIRNTQEAAEGRDQVQMWIRTRPSSGGDGPGFVDVTVEDDGPGFTDGMTGQVFDPYVTSKPRGTGLGLAIVKKLVEEHGGSIQAENREAGGARVIIRMPVNEEARAKMLLASAPARREVSGG